MIVSRGNQESKIVDASQPRRGMSGNVEPTPNEQVVTEPTGSVGTGAKGRWWNSKTNDVIEVKDMTTTNENGTITTYLTTNKGNMKMSDLVEYVQVENDFQIPSQPQQNNEDVEDMSMWDNLFNGTNMSQTDSNGYYTFEDTVEEDLGPSNSRKQTKTTNNVRQVQRNTTPKVDVKPDESVTVTAVNMPNITPLQKPSVEPVVINTIEDDLIQYIKDLDKFKNLLNKNVSGDVSTKKKTTKKTDNVEPVEPEGSCNAMLEAIISDFAEKLINTDEEGVIKIIDINNKKYKHIVDKAVELHPQFNLKNIYKQLKSHVSKLF